MTEEIEKYLHKHGHNAWDPRVALFDMDGVLYDSMHNHAIAWRDAMALYDISMTLEDAYKYEGMRGVETIKLIAKQQQGKDISDDEAAKMYDTKAEHYAKCNRAKLIPGVHKLQEDMKSYGLSIGVVTGSAQPTLISRILDDFNGLVSPEIIVTALNIKHGKPAPDPYLKGMEKAGAMPWQTIVVENAPLGVQAGVAAGCFTVAVNTGPLPDQELADAGADIVFSNMHDFRLWLPNIL